MKLRRESRMKSEVSTHSLNDIMFFLMLFFLIVSTMVVNSAIKINLPKSKAGKAISKQNIILAIDSNLAYYVNDKPFKFEELKTELSKLTQGDTAQEHTIVLRASKNIKVQDLIDVMSLGSEMKMKMVLATTNR